MSQSTILGSTGGLAFAVHRVWPKTIDANENQEGQEEHGQSSSLVRSISDGNVAAFAARSATLAIRVPLRCIGVSRLIVVVTVVA